MHHCRSLCRFMAARRASLAARSGMGAHNWGQALAARGYAVLLPNPRGSTGRGGEFTRSNRYDFGGGDYADIMAGVDHLIAQGIADPDRLGVCGWSYGGFMTAWIVGHTTASRRRSRVRRRRTG